MFLKHILNTDKHSLLYKFLQLQKLQPVKNDWVNQIVVVWKEINQIKSDKEIINLNLEDEEIEKMSKNQFKKLLKKKISYASLSYLNSIAESHSKSQPLVKK